MINSKICSQNGGVNIPRGNGVCLRGKSNKLHTLDHVPEIKAWAVLNESSKKSFMKKVEEIKEKMNQIYEQWLQE